MRKHTVVQVVRDMGMKGNVPIKERVWCLILPDGWNDSPRILCSGHPAESGGCPADDIKNAWEGEDGLIFKEKDGIVTCPKCLEMIRWFKNL